MFTSQELQALLALLSRVDLKGNEAMAVAQLQVKIQELVKKSEAVKASRPEESNTETPTSE